MYNTILYIIYNNSGYCPLYVHSVSESDNSVFVFVCLFTAIKRRNYYRFTKSLNSKLTNRKIKYMTIILLYY